MRCLNVPHQYLLLSLGRSLTISQHTVMLAAKLPRPQSVPLLQFAGGGGRGWPAHPTRSGGSGASQGLKVSGPGR